MPRLKLTKSAIDKLPFATAKQVDYFDTELKGFGLRVGKDSRTYFCMGRVHGKLVRQTIGKHGPWTVDQARDVAKDRLREMEKGIDPRHAPLDLQRLTVKGAFDDYLAARSLKSTTVRQYEQFRDLFAPWHNRALASVKRADVMQMFRDMTRDHGGAHTNTMFIVFGSVWNHASAVYEDLPANPVKVLSLTRSWNPRTRRQGHLDTKRFPEFYRAVHDLSAGHRDALLLLLYTGLRAGEAEGLLKTDVDLLNWTFTVQDTKSGRPLSLPMSKQTFDLIHRAAGRSKNPYVFQGKGAKGGVSLDSKELRRLGFEMVVHDLRRTFRNICEELAVPATTVKRLMNHSLRADITDSYAVLSVEYLRPHVDRIGEYVERLLKGASSPASAPAAPSTPQ